MDVVVIYGSVRSHRQGIRAARFVVKKLEERAHSVTLLDPLELGLPMIDRMYKEYEKDQAPEPLPTLAAQLRRADAFVVVSGEYNHGVPPALSNLLDHFLEEWFWRPSAIVSYSGGSFGGVRAAVHLRAVLAELGMPSIPSMFPVPRVQDTFDEAGVPHDPVYEKRVKRFLDELEWYARALADARKRGVPY